VKTPRLKSIKWDGRPIGNAGLYSNINLVTYHRGDICVGPSVSSSGLRILFSESPAHFYASWPGNPNFIEREDKRHFILGRATHHLMLGEPFFAKLFAVTPVELPHYKTGELRAWHGNNTECKQWLDKRAKEGRAVLSNADVENLRGMAQSLSLHPIVKAGALNGMIERSLFFIDKPTGLWVKARPDAIPETSVDFVDLKITRSVKWHDLQRAIADYGYHQQGALIRRAAREVLNITQPTFTLIFVEQEPPWCVRVVTLKDEDLNRGDQQNRMALDTIARCRDAKHWPGPGGEREDAENIELPNWVQTQIDDRLKYGIST
jgi:PDDEXK-like domain of unknown function (DUF3799)